MKKRGGGVFVKISAWRGALQLSTKYGPMEKCRELVIHWSVEPFSPYFDLWCKGVGKVYHINCHNTKTKICQYHITDGRYPHMQKIYPPITVSCSHFASSFLLSTLWSRLSTLCTFFIHTLQCSSRQTNTYSLVAPVEMVLPPVPMRGYFEG